MKKVLKTVGAFLLASMMLTSCYTYTSVVGEGPQGKGEVTQKNHYLIGGLAPIAVSDSKEMAEGAENYEVETKITFIDALLSGITSGIYTPTTTTVRK